MVPGHPADDTLALFRESVGGTLERHWPADRALALMGDTAAQLALWLEAGKQGWIGAAAGADGGGLILGVVLLEELGRAHCPLPLLDTAIAARSLERAPASLRDQWLGALHTGEIAVAICLGERGGDAGGGVVTATLGDGSSGTALSGRMRFVEVAPVTSCLLVVADPGPIAALLDVATPGVTMEPAPGMAALPLCDVAFVGAEGVSAWEIPGASAGELALLARLGCCARALGAAQRAHDLAVEHAKTRQQFDSPIGRFQAVQHRLADGRTTLDAARLLIEHAAMSYDDRQSGGWQRDVSVATAFAGPALRRVARDAQHVLAGVGYIEEHEAPRHFRQVHADTVRFGGAAAAREELASFALD